MEANFWLQFYYADGAQAAAQHAAGAQAAAQHASGAQAAAQHAAGAQAAAQHAAGAQAAEAHDAVHAPHDAAQPDPAQAPQDAAQAAPAHAPQAPHFLAEHERDEHGPAAAIAGAPAVATARPPATINIRAKLFVLDIKQTFQTFGLNELTCTYFDKKEGPNLHGSAPSAIHRPKLLPSGISVQARFALVMKPEISFSHMF